MFQFHGLTDSGNEVKVWISLYDQRLSTLLTLILIDPLHGERGGQTEHLRPRHQGVQQPLRHDKPVHDLQPGGGRRGLGSAAPGRTQRGLNHLHKVSDMYLISLLLSNGKRGENQIMIFIKLTKYLALSSFLGIRLGDGDKHETSGQVVDNEENELI